MHLVGQILLISQAVKFHEANKQLSIDNPIKLRNRRHAIQTAITSRVSCAIVAAATAGFWRGIFHSERGKDQPVTVITREARPCMEK